MKIISSQIFYRSFTVKFFFCIALCFSTSSSNAQSAIDSLKQLLNDAKSDSEKVLLLNQLSHQYFQTQDKNVGVYASEAIAIAKKISFEKGLAEALYNHGKYEMGIHKLYSAAAIDFIDAQSHFENLNDTLGLANCYMQLGVISYMLQYYEDAIKDFSQSLSLNQIPDIQNGVSNYLMAISFSELNDTLNGKKYFEKALKVYNQNNYKHGIVECYSYMGKMYVDANNLTEGQEYFDKVSADLVDDEDENTLARLNSFQAECFLKQNDIPKALKFGINSYNIGRRVHDEITYMQAADVLNNAYSKTGDYKNAFFYLNGLKLLNDSFYNSNTAQRIAEMKSKYGYEKKLLIEKQQEERRGALTQKEIEKQKIIRNSIGAFLIVVIGFLLFVFMQRRNLSKEKARSEKLLLNILPSEVAEELKNSESVHAKNYDMVSVMFADIKDFTKLSSHLSAKELVSEIDFYFSSFDRIITKYNIEKIKTIGDAYMCASGVPRSNPNHAIDIINAALELQKFISETAEKRKAAKKTFFEIRCGIHSGSVVAGVVGVKKFAYDIWGDTVNIAARMESTGEPSRVNISGTTYELIKDKFQCSYRGKLDVKNHGLFDMYYVDELL